MSFDDNNKFNAATAATDLQPVPTENERRTAFKFNFICKSKCKEFALKMAREHRHANKFGRVSEEFLIAAEAALKNFIVSRVKSQPSKGVTLK